MSSSNVSLSSSAVMMRAAARRRRTVVGVVRRNYVGITFVGLIVGFIAVSVAAPWVAPYHYSAVDFQARLEGPTASHWLGTDQLGRDTLSRLMFGGRISFGVGFATVAVAMVIAIALALFSAYYGGWCDLVVQRVVDIVLSFPGLILMIVIVSMFGTTTSTVAKISAVVIAIASFTFASATRLLRASALQVLAQPYVESARASGASDFRIMFRHVLPNIVGIILVLATVQVGGAIMLEAALSFLGFGIPPPYPSWGQMLSASVLIYMYDNPWLAVFPGVTLAITILSFNMVGDWLRDVLDPRLRGR